MRTENDVRDALTTLERHAPDPDAVLRAVRERSAPRRRTRWWASGLATAGAVGAAAAVFVATAAPAGPAPGVFRMPDGAAGSATGTGPGRNVLLTAATTAAHASPVSGKYWRTSTVTGNFRRVGSGDDTYLIVQRTRDEMRTSRSTGQMTGYHQSLGTQLGSARDRAAWRHDGSPTSWEIGLATEISSPDGYFDEADGPVGTTPGKRTADFGGDSTPGKPYMIGARELSPEQLRDLPADPAQLRKLILSAYDAKAGDGPVDAYLFSHTPDVLAMPVPPAVRSALYKMLADLDGVHAQGRVTDVAGRKGLAISLNTHYQQCADRGADQTSTLRPCTVQQRLVIDPETTRPLSRELRYVDPPAGEPWHSPGGLFSYAIYQD